jgi:hypothetical protein
MSLISLRRVVGTVLVAAILGFAPGYASAQGITTGSITGTVADPTGAVIPGATVLAVNPSTNDKFTSKATAAGSFSFQNLPIGTYTLTITGEGFAPLTVNNVLVTANRAIALGTEKLQTGGATSVVDVSAATNMLETTEAQVTTTFDTQQLENLPVAGGFDELALLIPGVVSTHATGFSNTNGVGISANGQRGRSNNFELDGQSNNDNSVAGPQVFFSNEDALSEIQIITNNFGAQYGRNMGSVVNYLTKSGSNNIHGSALYRYSGNFTSSHDTGSSKGPQFGFCAQGENPSDGCLPTVIPRYVSNKWGGTLGAPIIKDKLWAFGSTYFQHFYEYGALVSTQSLFPTPAGLSQLDATFPGSPAVAALKALNPYSVTAGNPRQLASVNPACPTGTCYATVSNGTTTATNVPFAPFGRQVPQVTLDQEDLGRIDYQITPKDRFYVRYFYQTNPTSPDGATANGGYVNVRDAVHSVGADLTHTFSSRWVDQLRYSFQQSTLAFDGGGFSSCTITNFASCPSSLGVGSVVVPTASSPTNLVGGAGLGLPNNLPQGRIVKAGQVQDNATWTLGRHAITFGGEFDYTNSPNTFLPNASGTFTYTSFNNFFAGNGTLSLTNGNPVIPFKENDYALYFQDDWKISPTFTANLGFRYEFFGQALNILHNLSVQQQTGANPFWSTALPLSRTTFPYTNPYYKNLEPRIGFAWTPAPKLVVRGGYAINVDPGFYNINLNVASSAPLVNAGTITCGGSVQCLPSGGPFFGTVSPADSKYIPTGGDPGDRNQTTNPSNFRNPYAQTYTLGVEYQVRNAAVFEVRYTGNHTVGNFQTLDGNPYLAPVAAAFPSLYTGVPMCTTATSTLADHADVGHEFCGSTNVRVRANTAFSIYNSLQMNLTTRNYHGITSTFAYTYSKTIDNTSEIFGTFGGGNTSAFAQNPLNPNTAERGDSAQSYPNIASASMTYSFPTIQSHGLVSKAVNGWQANTIWLFNSGQPYNDYDLYVLQSPATSSDPASYLSYGSSKIASAFNSSVDLGRPILSNKNAPAGTLGIYTDTPLPGGGYSAPFLVDYSTGAPISASKVRFIANNQLAAKLLGNPYPGSGRNILRGNTYNNVDFSIFKNTKITERVTFQLNIYAYNVLNRSYYGTPDNYQGDYPSGSFNNFLYNGASGSNIGPGTGVRNMEFGGKFLF